jgi:hypothetical protein
MVEIRSVRIDGTVAGIMVRVFYPNGTVSITAYENAYLSTSKGTVSVIKIQPAGALHRTMAEYPANNTHIVYDGGTV